MVEFVSANPTGPLHLGHGRQAALGDTLANLLERTGWAAYREYYYNDAGRQIERLGESVACRYLRHFGVDAGFPEDGYHGNYVAEIAEHLAAAEGDRFVDAAPGERLAACQRFAVRLLREEQDRDLADFGVHFDRYFLESSLYTDGAVDATIAALRETGHVYERDGATWLATTAFGDQKDRVMVKSDGNPTYFLPDVAYHMSKWRRGFQEVVNVQGSDHHGTVDRVRAGLEALSRPKGYPEYLLHQMVTVERGGVEVKLSKRSGGYTTLRELVDAVGADVVRYFFVMRKPEAHLVFDLDAALDHSDRNPVYKSKYAHARMCSIFRKAGMDPDAMSPDQLTPEGLDLSLLEHPRERELMGRLGEFPELVLRAARARAPHLVCEYLEHTAGMVNSWYHAGNPTRNPGLAVLAADPALRAARLALAGAVRVVLRNALTLLGVEAPTRMARRED
jgi:arginyl-tRNA synthetase